MQQSILSKISAWLKRRDKKIVSFKLTAVMEDGSVESLVVDKVIVDDSIKSGSKVASMNSYELDWIKKQTQRFKGVNTLYRVCDIVPKRGYVYKLITDRRGGSFVVESNEESTTPEDSKRLKIDLALYGTDWLLDGDHAYGKVHDVDCQGVERVSFGAFGADRDRLVPGIYLFPQPSPTALALLTVRKQAEHNHAAKYSKGEVYFGGIYG